MNFINPMVPFNAENSLHKNYTDNKTLDAIHDISKIEVLGCDTQKDIELEKNSFLDDTISNILSVCNTNDEFVKFTPPKSSPTAKMSDKESFRSDVYRNDNDYDCD